VTNAEPPKPAEIGTPPATTQSPPASPAPTEVTPQQQPNERAAG
jgi:hypothetical protein